MYKGKSFLVDCSRGGITDNPNIMANAPVMMRSTSKNLNLHNGGREKRGGTDHLNVGDTAISGTPEIRGLFQARYEDGDTFLVAADENGKIWKDYSTEITNATGIASIEAVPTAGGTGYSVNDILVIDEGTGGSVTVTAETGGVVDTVELTTAGTGYTTGSGKATTSGNNDCTIEILSVNGIMSTTNKFDFNMGDDLLFVCDGANEPRTSDGGANLAVISVNGAVAADWSNSSVYPKYMLVHGRGVSRRMWAFGVPGTSSQINKTLYYSESGDLDDFAGGAGETAAGTIIIETADDTGIVGAVEFGDRIIAFSKTKAFLIDDSGAIATWGYAAAQWAGGVAHHRLIVETPNDVVCMDGSGNIYSIRSAQEYGDYRAASLSRPAWIHKWIQDNVDLSKIEDFHMQYDARLRAIKIFVRLTSGTQVDTCLVYFIDRGPEEGWMIHDATNADSGYQAAASTPARDSSNVPYIYTGDYAGYVWKLETSNLHDNSNVFDCVMETVQLFMGDPHTQKLLKRYELLIQSRGVANLTVAIDVDDASAPGGVLVLTAAGSSLGDILGPTFILGGDEETPETVSLYINRRGERVRIKITNSSTIEDFFISGFRLDYKPLGHRLV